MSILSAVPSKLRAGDTLRLLLTLADHDATSWTSVLYFENATGKFNSAGSASGTDHSFTIAASTTAGKKPGSYKWFVRASSAGVVETVLEGWIDIEADPAASTNADRRSWARRTLDAVEATLEGKATADQLAVTINGRSISRIPLTDLTNWRSVLRQEVRTEEQGSAAGSGRDIKVRIA